MKLYVRERGSAGVHRLVSQAAAVATSVVAYAEARAALARLLRERPRGRRRHRERVEQLDRDWERYAKVELSPSVVRDAGTLAETHALRGFDAIHLASAKSLEAVRADEVVFAAFDRRLAAAAHAAGLALAHPEYHARRRRAVAP